MNFTKQVDKSIYEFARYMSKARWASVWHQLDELLRLSPERALEIGPGAGVVKQVAALYGLRLETLDLDPELRPDHVGSVTALPFPDATFDVVCAFQVLEHLPYEAALAAFREMARASRRHVLISLPDAQPVWAYRLHLPKLGPRDFLVPRPRLRAPDHVFDGEHHWELNKRGHPLARVLGDLTASMPLVRTYRVFENPSHRFLLFEHPARRAPPAGEGG